MEVLHFTEFPLSSAPLRLMKVQQEFWQSRLIMHRDQYSQYTRLKYPADIVLQKDQYDPQEIEELFGEADILHFHNFYRNHYVFNLFPHLLKYLETKKVVYQVHSPRTNIPDLNKIMRDKTVDKFLVLAQYQARQFPDFTVVPNVVPINDELHKPIERSMDKIRICYSPSNSKLKGWNDKGYKDVIKAIKKCTGNFEFILIENTPHLECLKIKQSCHICIDEVITGSYHMSSLEALAQGLVVINNIDDECEEALSKFTGTREHPMITANNLSLIPVLQELIDNPNLIKFHMGSSRNFMERFWNTENILDYFEGIYND